MVAETTEITWTYVGAEQLFPMIGFVVLKHEIGMKDSRATILIMKPFPIVHHGWGHNNLIEYLPVSLMLQGAFKPQSLVLSEQIDEAAFLHLTRMACTQHIVDTRIGGTVVQVAHHDDFWMIALRSGCHNRVHLASQQRGRTRTRPYGFQLTTVTTRPVVDEDMNGIILFTKEFCVEDIP